MKPVWILFTALLMTAAGPATASEFLLSSSDMPDGGRIAGPSVNRDCNGGNLSPPLAWSGAPAGTRSFAVTIHDPDAPKTGGWWHWLAFDMPASTISLGRGAASGGLPAGTRQGRNDYGERTYDGPCPPAGAPHRYVITVWALNVEHLAHDPATAPGDLAAVFQRHALEKARLTGTYGR